MENNTTSQNIESIILEESKIDITRDGSGKRIDINTTYLGAMKQIPVLLKGIYELMPNIDVYICAHKDLGDPININIIEKELKSSKFYSETINLDKIHFRKYSTIGADLNIDFSVSILPTSKLASEKISYDLHKNPQTKILYIWIDPLKFEPRKLLSEEEQNALRKKYGIDKNDYVIIGGSIATPEFQSFIEAIRFAKSSEAFSSKIIVPIVVPRTNIECETMRFAATKIKSYNRSMWFGKKKWNDNIIFVEEKGVLADLYSIADIAFIGDTLIIEKSRGQNPLEPAFYGKRIIAGNYHVNNSIAFNGLNKSGLLTYVNSEEELKREFAKIVPEAEMELYRKNASEFIKSEQGAAIKYAKKMQEIIYK